jgi:acyl-homoserine lactone acylase PvdQ
MRKLIGAIVMCAALLAATGATAQTASPVKEYGTNDGGEIVLNILPPGQGRYMNGPELLLAQLGGDQPPHNTDQIEMYDSLVQATPGLTADRLTEYFKDATFGVLPDDIATEYSPRDGLTILRDESFGVPHVYGETRSDVMFGAGYVTAEDRLFMMDTLRHVGRGRASEFLGASEANLEMDRAFYATAGYDEEEYEAMADRLMELDPVRGAQAIQDVQDYSEGVNAYIDEALTDPSKLPGEYEALQQIPREWIPTDTAAVASLIGSQLGVGGGGELRNAAFLSALRKKGFDDQEARAIFDDLRHAEDPEAPTTTEKRFEWNNHLGPVDPASVAFPDDAEEVARRAEERSSMPGYLDGPFGRIQLAFPSQMSNTILVDAKHSESGRPIAVIGPQVGYWSPEILNELDLHGPGIDARGVGFPGISMYVLLGRGQDYAWSATSAGGDQVDIFAEELCDPDGGEVDPDSTFYVNNGDCVEMFSRTDTWLAKPSAGGIPPVPPGPENILVEMTVERTDDGIVQARGQVDGKPVAFVSRRSSFGGEVDGALTYVDIMDADKIRSAEDFQEAFSRFNFTFNWFYIIRSGLAGWTPTSRSGEPGSGAGPARFQSRRTRTT